VGEGGGDQVSNIEPPGRLASAGAASERKGGAPVSQPTTPRTTKPNKERAVGPPRTAAHEPLAAQDRHLKREGG